MREAAKKEVDAGGLPRDRCIVNVSSTTGTHGNPGQVVLFSSKSNSESELQHVKLPIQDKLF